MKSWETRAKNVTRSSFEVPPEGRHYAILIGLAGLGTQHDVFRGVPRTRYLVAVAFELMGVRQGDGSAFVVQTDFNLLEELAPTAKLRIWREAWLGRRLADGEPVDLPALVGQACLLTINHGTARESGNTYDKPVGIAPAPPLAQPVRPTLEPFVVNDPAEPLQAPAWWRPLYGRSIAEWAAASDEAQARRNGHAPAAAAQGPLPTFLPPGNGGAAEAAQAPLPTFLPPGNGAAAEAAARKATPPGKPARAGKQPAAPPPPPPPAAAAAAADDDPAAPPPAAPAPHTNKLLAALRARRAAEKAAAAAAAADDEDEGDEDEGDEDAEEEAPPPRKPARSGKAAKGVKHPPY